MLKTIKTTTELIRDAVRSRVYVAETLGAQWEEITGLYCDELRLAAAPTVDSASLSYDYGPMRREEGDVFLLEERLEILGKYCKIVLEEATPEKEDVTWYGIVEVDSTIPFGSGSEEDQPAGRQSFTAFGLIRMLERVYVLHSQVDWSKNSAIPYNPLKLEHGLRFNKRDKKLTARKGNRSEEREESNPKRAFVFSESQTANDLWTIGQAAEYILLNHAPKDGNGDPVADWEIADREGLDWDTPVLETDGKTVKQVLDALISRKRGFSYVLEYDETKGAKGTVTLRAFSFADAPVTMPDFREIPENPEQYSLNFERALDVDVRIVDAITDSYDVVVAIGTHATSTFTIAWGYQANNWGAQWQIATDWSDAQHTSYLAGASASSGYNDLLPLQKQERNTRARNAPALRPVFRRWKIYPWWDGRVWNYEQDENTPATKYLINPRWPDDDRDTDPNATPDAAAAVLTTTGEDPPPIWPQGIEWEPHLPFLDRCDYSADRIESGEWEDDLTDGIEPSFREFLFYIRTDQLHPYRYELLEKLSEQASNELQRRRWSVQPRVLHDRPAFELHVSGAPQHFLASQIQAAIVDTEAFQTGSKEGALSWYAIRSTVCAKLPWRVQQRVRVRAEPIAGRQERILYLPVDARLDYVVPDTVVNVENGTPVLSTTGGFVRDDRQHLADVAQAAANWYQSERQTLFFRLRGVNQVVPIGSLIKEVGGKYKLEGINTVVTSMTLDLRSQQTAWETSFAEVEFS